MNKNFFEFTTEDGRVLINASSISMIASYENETIIYFTSHTQNNVSLVSVKENYEKVKSIIGI